ncbi:hypothetical protein MNEG_10820 [Monoraphidium neglectum]|uniref:DUF1995 domain-containing protein n=1 Tax=Monoraphidium neglectum TaxID=145388 RepID=A0A0D2M7N8_9CHLO|nr:hypothetical protein MNEG_10820 [Monoraphidium neglectum]KIY97141.1 hypothetical protein MNEG_10820 [Monoraphidium neglectum]|eukprot:XP_013896161.1 hypothetical protein MNEG_10820 [Monoraphidium neglectum]
MLHWRFSISASPTGAPIQQQQAVYVDIPESQDAAVQQSAAALIPQLKPLLAGGAGGSSAAKKAKKGFGAKTAGGGGNGGYQRFAVELPVADTSPAATAALALEVLKLLPGAPAAWQIVYADPAAAAAAARAGQARAQPLRDACRAEALGGPLLIVSPTIAEVALVEQLVQEVWSGPCAVALNPSWGEGVPREYEAVVRSFEVAYSFMPVAIKGLVGGQEGAVLRRTAKGGSLAGVPWQILTVQRDGRFLQVGQMKTRPKQSDLELAFMNASAASSPITGAVRSAKSILDRVRGAGKQQ